MGAEKCLHQYNEINFKTRFNQVQYDVIQASGCIL